MTPSRHDIGGLIGRGVLAGAAGGLAEIVWVSLYATATGANAASVAHGVTTAAGVSALLPEAPVAMGIAFHMTLAVLLGIALAGLWQALAPRLHGVTGLYAVLLATLATIWAINFFVVLPLISPAFAHIVPYSVSLMSKLLFAVAAAEILRRYAPVGATRVPVRSRD
jgi:hypothetical protein